MHDAARKLTAIIAVTCLALAFSEDVDAKKKRKKRRRRKKQKIEKVEEKARTAEEPAPAEPAPAEDAAALPLPELPPADPPPQPEAAAPTPEAIDTQPSQAPPGPEGPPQPVEAAATAPPGAASAAPPAGVVQQPEAPTPTKQGTSTLHVIRATGVGDPSLKQDLEAASQGRDNSDRPYMLATPHVGVATVDESDLDSTPALRFGLAFAMQALAEIAVRARVEFDVELYSMPYQRFSTTQSAGAQAPRRRERRYGGLLGVGYDVLSTLHVPGELEIGLGLSGDFIDNDAFPNAVVGTAVYARGAFDLSNSAGVELGVSYVPNLFGKQATLATAGAPSALTGWYVAGRLQASERYALRVAYEGEVMALRHAYRNYQRLVAGVEIHLPM